MLQNISKSIIYIIQVAQQSSEGKQYHRYSDKQLSIIAHACCQSCLYIRRTSKLLSRLDAGAQAHESGSGTNQQSINKYGQHLNQALLNRVRNVSCSSSVRRRTNTCFVAVQTALDTKHHAAAGKATENCSEVKCFGKNFA